MLLVLSNMVWGGSVDADADAEKGKSYLYRVNSVNAGGDGKTHYVFGTFHAISLEDLPEPLSRAVSDAMSSADVGMLEYDMPTSDDKITEQFSLDNAVMKDGSSFKEPPGDTQGWLKLVSDYSIRQEIMKVLNNMILASIINGDGSMKTLPSCMLCNVEHFDPIFFRKLLEQGMFAQRQSSGSAVWTSMDEKIAQTFRDKTISYLETNESRRAAAAKAITAGYPAGVDTLEDNVQWLENYFMRSRNREKQPEVEALEPFTRAYKEGNIHGFADASCDFRNSLP